jgi:hypothetical protein
MRIVDDEQIGAPACDGAGGADGKVEAALGSGPAAGGFGIS